MQTESSDGVWTVEPGAPVGVVRNGGAFDRLGVIAELQGDDEILPGTWVGVVIDPELPERLHVSALKLPDEAAARAQSAIDRRVYFAWNIQDGNGPN